MTVMDSAHGCKLSRVNERAEGLSHGWCETCNHSATHFGQDPSRNRRKVVVHESHDMPSHMTGSVRAETWGSGDDEKSSLTIHRQKETELQTADGWRSRPTNQHDTAVPQPTDRREAETQTSTGYLGEQPGGQCPDRMGGPQVERRMLPLNGHTMLRPRSTGYKPLCTLKAQGSKQSSLAKGEME